MAEITKFSKDDETLTLISDYASYTAFAKNFLFSYFTLAFAVFISLIFAYVSGKRSIIKNVIIDTTLKLNLENVELNKKKLIKKIHYWKDTIDLTKWFIVFLFLLILIYTVLYFLNPDYVELVNPIIKNSYFVQITTFLFIFLFSFIRYAVYKQNNIKNAFNDIDQKAQSLFEDIINKMGSKLTKSMAEALRRKRAIKETKGGCKKEICKKQKSILYKKSINAQNLLGEIGKFDWCPICSSEIEFINVSTNLNNNQNINEKNIEEEMKKMNETDETKCRSTVEKTVQTEEIICKKNCGKRFFKYCKTKGRVYKEQIDEVSREENQLRQMEAEFNKENVTLK